MGISIKRHKVVFQLGYVVALITLLSLFLLSKATEGSEKFEALYQSLLLTIVIGISCLFVIVGLLLWQTFRNYQRGIAGASLSLTILWRTLLLAIIPLFFISFFAFKFLRYEFQSSFDKGIDAALTNALVLSQKALNVRALQALRDSRSVARLIAPYEYVQLQENLESIRNDVHADELTVFDEKGFIQAFSSKYTDVIVPLTPEHSDFIRVENEGGIFVINSENGRFNIRVLTDINKAGAPNYYLQAVFQIPDTISDLTDQVNRTVSERDRFNYLMPKVSNSFIFVLILVLLLACLLLILSAVGFASDMSQPIRDLLRGTKRVSGGDFERPITVKRQDDFGTLINSFNQMTQSLKTAIEEATINREKVESERAYLATVINHMTAAVITLDFRQRLLTFNEHAEKLLDCPLTQAVYADVELMALELENYKNFISQLDIERRLHRDEEIEIELEQSGTTKHFIARLASLPSTDELHGGYVIIFEKFGQYLQRQKQAAWEEVARRLAHEIKNPLTPILLAAERLNYKLAQHLPEKEQAVLQRSTDVISHQVKSLKNMVDDFSHYAKPTTAKKTPIQLNALLKDIFDLYQGHFDGITFSLQRGSDDDRLMGNANALRQVFHNLIKNAMEACENQTPAEIVIRSYNERGQLLVSISDNGCGLPDNRQTIFEPYTTTKEKGTGLGLAIVKKILAEHNAVIDLSPRQDIQGSIATVKFSRSEKVS